MARARPPAPRPGVRPQQAEHPAPQPRRAVTDGPVDRDRLTQWGGLFGLLPVLGWTVDLLTQALVGHCAGSFAQSARLAEDMSAHPWIRLCLQVRGEFRDTCPRVVTPAQRRGDGRRCADFVREAWDEFFSPAAMADVHRHELMMGAGVGAVNWEERRDGRDRWWLPVVQPWEPSLLSYQLYTDPLSVDGGSYVATTMSHGRVLVQPGAGRWVVFRRRALRPWLDGLVRVLGDAFVGEGYNFRDLMVFQEKHGRGITKLFYPRSWRDDEILATAQSLRQGGGGGVLPCPTDPEGNHLVDAEQVRADGTGWQTYGATEARLRQRITIAILRQDMTTTGSTGLAENDPRKHSLWKCREEDARTYGDACLTWEEVEPGVRVPVWAPTDGVIRTQVLSHFAEYNFGSRDLAPYVWWDATPPEDFAAKAEALARHGQQRAQALSQLSQALDKLRTGGVTLEESDVAHLAEQCGLSLRAPQAGGQGGPSPASARTQSTA